MLRAQAECEDASQRLKAFGRKADEIDIVELEEALRVSRPLRLSRPRRIGVDVDLVEAAERILREAADRRQARLKEAQQKRKAAENSGKLAAYVGELTDARQAQDDEILKLRARVAAAERTRAEQLDLNVKTGVVAGRWQSEAEKGNVRIKTLMAANTRLDAQTARLEERMEEGEKAMEDTKKAKAEEKKAKAAEKKAKTEAQKLLDGRDKVIADLQRQLHAALQKEPAPTPLKPTPLHRTPPVVRHRAAGNGA